MPHFIIHCSKSILSQVSGEKLISEVHSAAFASNLFSKNGAGQIKVRISAFEQSLIGGQQQDFIHVFAHIMEGRTEEQKNELSHLVVRELKKMFTNPFRQYFEKRTERLTNIRNKLIRKRNAYNK